MRATVTPRLVLAAVGSALVAPFGITSSFSQAPDEKVPVFPAAAEIVQIDVVTGPGGKPMRDLRRVVQALPRERAAVVRAIERITYQDRSVRARFGPPYISLH